MSLRMKVELNIKQNFRLKELYVMVDNSTTFRSVPGMVPGAAVPWNEMKKLV